MQSLADTYLRRPLQLTITPEGASVSEIRHVVHKVENKNHWLKQLLVNTPRPVLIYVQKKDKVDELVRELNRHDVTFFNF